MTRTEVDGRLAIVPFPQRVAVPAGVTSARVVMGTGSMATGAATAAGDAIRCAVIYGRLAVVPAPQEVIVPSSVTGARVVMGTGGVAA